MTWRLALASLAVALGGCGLALAPVEVSGADASLAGIWQGTYESRDTGRSGNVTLALSAAADSAVGEVVMVPRGTVVRASPAPDGTWTWDSSTTPHVLSVRFVRFEAGRVVGELDPYADPDCGCTLQTIFRGRVEGDAVTGTFTTRSEHAAHNATGTWQARRSQ